MGKIIYINSFKGKNVTKGDEMYKNIKIDIRSKSKDIKDMPARAQEILKHFEINDLTQGIPIVEILSKLGFKVYQSNLEPDDLLSYIAVDPKFEDVFGTSRIVCVHIKESIGHKRFALAHELARYLFDFNENENLYYYSAYFRKREGTIDMEEERANKFATNLLMPEQEFRKQFEEIKKIGSKADVVSTLARCFLVSSKAVLMRFKELGIEGYIMDSEI